MKDQLRLLEALQRHDAHIQEIEGARRAIPAKLEDMRGDLSRLEALLEHERAALDESERWQRDKADEIKVEESQLSRAKQKLQQVKNTKEYMATQREVDTLRKMASETEEKLQQFTQAATEARDKIAAHQADVDKLRAVVAREEELAAKRLAELEASLGESRQGRDSAAAAVRPDVLKKYNNIKMRRGLAVVAVESGTCRGCNMNVPPQLYNQLQRADSIELCPNCHRIVYWSKLFEDADGQPAEAE